MMKAFLTNCPVNWKRSDVFLPVTTLCLEKNSRFLLEGLLDYTCMVYFMGEKDSYTTVSRGKDLNTIGKIYIT
jgi:hypothetical protein